MNSFKKKFKLTIIAFSLIFAFSILVGCQKSENNPKNIQFDVVLSFLEKIYVVDEKDRDEFAEIIETADESPEKFEEFISKRFTSDKFELGEDTLETLNLNRDTAFMLVRAVNENTTFTSGKTSVIFDDSMDYYEYSFPVINQDTGKEEVFKGTVRLEDGKIAYCEIGKKPE